MGGVDVFAVELGLHEGDGLFADGRSAVKGESCEALRMGTDWWCWWGGRSWGHDGFPGGGQIVKGLI